LYKSKKLAHSKENNSQREDIHYGKENMFGTYSSVRKLKSRIYKVFKKE
jgi:hypothetical protein